MRARWSRDRSSLSVRLRSLSRKGGSDMPNPVQNQLGAVASIWRYPVKSMLGEESNATEVSDRGLLGDRAYALVDGSDGKVATAKNPRKWPNLFAFRAAFVEPPRIDGKAPPVQISLPNGTVV